MRHSSKTHLTWDEYNELTGILLLAAGAVERGDAASLTKLALEANDITGEVDEGGSPRASGFTSGMIWAGVNDPALLLRRLGITVKS